MPPELFRATPRLYRNLSQQIRRRNFNINIPTRRITTKASGSGPNKEMPKNVPWKIIGGILCGGATTFVGGAYKYYGDSIKSVDNTFEHFESDHNNKEKHFRSQVGFMSDVIPEPSQKKFKRTAALDFPGPNKEEEMAEFLKKTRNGINEEFSWRSKVGMNDPYKETRLNEFDDVKGRFTPEFHEAINAHKIYEDTNEIYNRLSEKDKFKIKRRYPSLSPNNLYYALAEYNQFYMQNRGENFN